MRRGRLSRPDVELRAVGLAPPGGPLLTVDPPPVEHLGATLGPDCDVVEPELESAPPALATSDLAPLVDTVPVRLVGSIFAERRRDLELAVAPVVTAALPATEERVPRLRPGPAEAVAVHRDGAARMLRQPTPLDRLPAGTVRTLLTRLVASARIPADQLALVGVFERVPGGAIASVALHQRGVVLRVDPDARARPATLVVGRRRRDGAVVTVEVEPLTTGR